MSAIRALRDPGSGRRGPGSGRRLGAAERAGASEAPHLGAPGSRLECRGLGVRPRFFGRTVCTGFIVFSSGKIIPPKTLPDIKRHLPSVALSSGGRSLSALRGRCGVLGTITLEACTLYPAFACWWLAPRNKTLQLSLRSVWEGKKHRA